MVPMLCVGTPPRDVPASRKVWQELDIATQSVAIIFYVRSSIGT